MSYVLLFRTHVWNDFTERSFERLRARMVGGDACILADETNGIVPCPPELKIPHRASQFASMGLLVHPQDRTMWYNGDYPLYHAYAAYPHYDFYAMIEFDVVINTDFDKIISELKRTRTDMVTHALMKAIPDWVWRETAEPAYDQVFGSINALSILSNRAVRHLYEARVDLSRRFEAGQIARWPYCEAFIASELMQAGFHIRELKEFGSVKHFSWWPPLEEEVALRELGQEAFLHPVLTREPYLRSLTKYDVVDGVPFERTPDVWERAFAEALGRPDQAH